MLINQDSYQSCTALGASPSKSGIRTVPHVLDLVQNGHIKRLTDQDIQSSVL